MTEKIREGDLHKIVTIAGTRFEIRYGYSTDAERERWEPTPIYPDFLQAPQYTPEGFPFTTVYQDICQHYEPKPKATGEGWCNDCMRFSKQEEYIGICQSPKRHLNAMNLHQRKNSCHCEERGFAGQHGDPHP